MYVRVSFMLIFAMKSLLKMPKGEIWVEESTRMEMCVVSFLSVKIFAAGVTFKAGPII